MLIFTIRKNIIVKVNFWQLLINIKHFIENHKTIYKAL